MLSTEPATSTLRPMVLGSGSPRRRLLFEFLGINHECITADVDERAIEAKSAREFALKAAFVKACAFETRLERGRIVITADTVVALNGKIYFKPRDRLDAIRMLTELAGRTHQVYTGVALKEIGAATQLDAVVTDVTIRDLSLREIENYVDSGEPMDKAGSYGIQGLGGTLVQSVDGDYYNVVGLPIDVVLNMLESHMDVTMFREKRKLLTPSIFSENQ